MSKLSSVQVDELYVLMTSIRDKWGYTVHFTYKSGVDSIYVEVYDDYEVYSTPNYKASIFEDKGKTYSEVLTELWDILHVGLNEPKYETLWVLSDGDNIIHSWYNKEHIVERISKLTGEVEVLVDDEWIEVSGNVDLQAYSREISYE